MVGALVAATLIAAGDIASCSSRHDEETAALIAELPGTVATLGDNVYDSFACFSWERFRARLRPAIGNHDDDVGRDAYLRYFGLERTYYAYRLGAWRVYVLDSERNIARQTHWLRRKLRAAPARCVLAYWHRPRYSSGRHGGTRIVEPFWRELAGARADVVLAGHDHHYERFAPVEGIRQFVVGTGGRNLYPVIGREQGSEVVDTRTFGVLALTLRPGGYDWRFAAIPGSASGFADEGSAGC